MTTQVDDQLWSAVADPSRRRVIDLLVTNGEVSASWLAGHVSFSRQAVSKHLAVLEEAGLVSRRKQGKEVLYEVQVSRLDQATRAMADLAAQWDRRLVAIKRLAEAAHAEAKKKVPTKGVLDDKPSDRKSRRVDKGKDRTAAGRKGSNTPQ
jgi:ArsR family transcriptional regulator, cadmium/lead-responsive transcriptional repressor